MTTLTVAALAYAVAMTALFAVVKLGSEDTMPVGFHVPTQRKGES